MSPSACLPSPKTPNLCSAVVLVLHQLSGNSNEKSRVWWRKLLKSKNVMMKNLHYVMHALLGGSCTTLCTQNGTWALRKTIQWATMRAAPCGILTIWEIKRWMEVFSLLIQKSSKFDQPPVLPHTWDARRQCALSAVDASLGSSWGERYPIQVTAFAPLWRHWKK